MTEAITTKSGGLPAILSRPYKYLRLEWTGELGMLRVRTCVKPIQCYSLAGLTEMQRVLDDIAENPGVVRHLVLSSDVTGVFNFGGDLALFVLLVRAQDIDSLKMYGRRCVDLVWWLEHAAQRGVDKRQRHGRRAQGLAGSFPACQSRNANTSPSWNPSSSKSPATVGGGGRRAGASSRAAASVRSERARSERHATLETLPGHHHLHMETSSGVAERVAGFL